MTVHHTPATLDSATPADSVVASMTGVSKSFGRTRVLDDVTFSITENRIHGLLGRNGVGKTTTMGLLTGQSRATSGTVEVFGEDPWENRRALAGTCFIRESQKYPEDYRVRHALAAASHLLPDWDGDYAERLMDDFRLPPARKVKKLSRGMTSALGIVIGLASRAPLTFFDEPYLGLDAAARALFYDHLLADFAASPRTIVLSTHLIDEVSSMLDRVVVLDHGTVVLERDAEELRGTATEISGRAETVAEFVGDRPVLRTSTLGHLRRVTVACTLDDSERERARTAGLVLDAVSLQDLVVALTATGTREDTPA